MSAAESSIALVTGSSSGIGKAIALRLAQDGYFVLVHFNSNEEGARRTAEEIRVAGGLADIVGFDVANSEQSDQVLTRWFDAKAENRKLGVLVNNAGTHEDTLAGLMSDDMFDRVLRTNLYGPFYLMRWAVRRMLRLRAGTIVNISSLSGQVGNPGQMNYSASKAGLIAMTKTLSMELGPRGIRVNAVAPGVIESDMTENIPQLEQIKSRIPLGRFGRADEISGVVSFLCSKDASYITGHTISVNGGLFPS